jgi:hypothetical protein
MVPKNRQLDISKVELARDQIMNVICVNKSELFRLYTRLLTLFLSLEVLGESVYPQLRSILGEAAG